MSDANSLAAKTNGAFVIDAAQTDSLDQEKVNDWSIAQHTQCPARCSCSRRYCLQSSVIGHDDILGGQQLK